MTSEQLPRLNVHYFPDTDTLALRADGRQQGIDSETVANGLVAHLGVDGEVIGFTLEGAAALLQHSLSK